MLSVRLTVYVRLCGCPSLSVSVCLYLPLPLSVCVCLPLSLSLSLSLWETDFYTPPLDKCWEVLPFLTIQHHRCITFLCPDDPECYTPLALNCQRGQQPLPALEVYKNQSSTLSLSLSLVLWSLAVFLSASVFLSICPCLCFSVLWKNPCSLCPQQNRRRSCGFSHLAHALLLEACRVLSPQWLKCSRTEAQARTCRTNTSRLPGVCGMMRKNIHHHDMVVLVFAHVLFLPRVGGWNQAFSLALQAVDGHATLGHIGAWRLRISSRWILHGLAHSEILCVGCFFFMRMFPSHY